MLKIHNVSLKRGNFEIKNINLVIKEGITNFLGPSGSGKSTLLDIIAGFLKPQEGKIELYNQDITLLEPFLRNISYCPQDFYLFPHLNVKENILISKKYGLEIYDNWENLIKELELENHLQKRINELSIGEKQRVALARSLIVKKKLLLLDEPFSSISESLKTKLWKLIKRIQKEREIILIISTHNIKEALYLSDYLVIIDEGKIIDQGEP
ncbi:MAG: ATP-binding cassette domain-containing protein, partial [bacterium]